jgi:ribosomal-protein-alanine N-acetyltransferase
MIRAAPAAFRTHRLLAQRLDERHLDDLARLYAEPAVTDWLGGGRTRDEVCEWLVARVEPHWEQYGFGLYAVYERQGPPVPATFVGRAGLTLAAPDVTAAIGESKAVELLYAIMPTQWGRGYATEIGRMLIGLAIGPLDLDSVIAYTLPDNERSRRVLEKIGFAEEGEIVHEDLPHVLYRRRRG